MGKVLQFRKIIGKARQAQQVASSAHGMQEAEIQAREVDDVIGAIANDHSLTPANRRWLLENLLMDIDDQLEEYKREMDLAEQRLEALVKASERSIAAAYQEYTDRITTLTASVHQLTNGERRS